MQQLKGFNGKMYRIPKQRERKTKATALFVKNEIGFWCINLINKLDRVGLFRTELLSSDKKLNTFEITLRV